MQSLRVGLEAGIGQIPESDVEASCAAGSAVVVVAFAGDSCDHWTVRTSVLVASLRRSADIVAAVGHPAVPSEQADHSAQKIRSVVVQSQLENACCSAVRDGPPVEATVGTVAEAAGEPLAAL